MDFTLLLLLGLVVYVLYKWSTTNHNYFCGKGIKFIKPLPFFGVSINTFTGKLTIPEHLRELYNVFPEEKMVGLFEFRKPILLIRDLKVLKEVAIKKFDHFVDHRQIFNLESNPLLANSLGSMTGGKWKDMRAAISPAFTGSKIRQMFEHVSMCGANMAQTLGRSGRQSYEMKELFTRYTNDVIATSAFGIEVNSFEDADNDFFKLGQKVAHFGFKTGMKILGYVMMPGLMGALKVSIFDAKALTYFQQLIKTNFEIRESTKIVRNDLVQLLLQLKMGKSIISTDDEHHKDTLEDFAAVEESEIGKKTVLRTWTDDEVLAQCFVFFVAGFETASNLLHFLAYELALNVDVQNKLFTEIQTTNSELESEKLTYEALQKMRYLDMVVSEGLRKWPPAPVTGRMCTTDCYLDIDGKRVHVENGQLVWIPIYAYQHDHKFFPNPAKFDPERFNDSNKHKIQAGSYIPFGIGPRNCIGSRFALMETKAVLYYLLLNFSFELNSKTEIPVKVLKNRRGLSSNGVHLDLVPRT